MTSCRFNKSVLLFLKGELPPQEEILMKEHVQHCTICQAKLESEKQLSSLLTQYADHDVPLDLSQKTLSRVLSEMDRQQMKVEASFFAVFSPFFIKYRLAAATVMVLLLISTYLIRISIVPPKVSFSVSLAELQPQVPDIPLQDRYLNLLNLEGREREEVKEVLSQLNRNEEIVISSSSRVFHSIDYSTENLNVRPTTAVYFVPDDY